MTLLEIRINEHYFLVSVCFSHFLNYEGEQSIKYLKRWEPNNAGVGIIPQIKLDSDNGKDLFAVPYWCAQRVGDLANSNMEATVVSQTVQVGSQTYECDVPAFTNSVKLAKGDEVKIYMCKTESAASLSEPATKRGRH